MIVRHKRQGNLKQADIEERGQLYREIAELIWDPDGLLEEVEV